MTKLVLDKHRILIYTHVEHRLFISLFENILTFVRRDRALSEIFSVKKAHRWIGMVHRARSYVSSESSYSGAIRGSPSSTVHWVTQICRRLTDVVRGNVVELGHRVILHNHRLISAFKGTLFTIWKFIDFIIISGLLIFSLRKTIHDVHLHLLARFWRRRYDILVKWFSKAGIGSILRIARRWLQLRLRETRV